MYMYMYTEMHSTCIYMYMYTEMHSVFGIVYIICTDYVCEHVHLHVHVQFFCAKAFIQKCKALQ